MKNVIAKAMSGISLFITVLLVACGNGNCPSGQSMYNGVCTYSQGVNGVNGQCAIGQLQSQYGCLQTNINGCTGNMGWSTQTNSCVAGTPVTSYGTNTGYNPYNPYGNSQVPYNQYNPNGGYYNPGGQAGACQGGFVYTQMSGCVPQGGCPYGMGMTAYGCTR